MVWDSSPGFKMTLQQKSTSSLRGDGAEVKSGLREKEKKMKTAMLRRHSASSAITKALSKPRTQNSRNSLIQNFSTQSRMFIMDDCIRITMGLQTQERHLFLFTDTLIIAKSKSSASLKVKQQLELCEMWIASCVHEVTGRKLSSKNSFVIGWPTTNCVVSFRSNNTKEKWLSALQWHINRLKPEEHPNKIAIKIMLFSGNSPSTTTVLISNMDTTEKVISISTKQLGMPGRSVDYCLWVISGREEAPYPLIGHEYPFSIIMNCLRNHVDQPHSTDNILTYDVIIEQLPKEQQVQFVLRWRKSIHNQSQSSVPEIFQKHIGKKKSLIDWALRKGNSSWCGGESHLSTAPRKLFGHSLPSICHNGNLPKPILDMLILLYQEGPRTKGIFRRSANVKTCKELKERLNSGSVVQLEAESVFVVASVITDFLRNVPGSVLSTELYEKWMEVLDIDGHDEQIKTIKGLLNQLPEANTFLLQHLFCLLYHIQENSEENQMNACNLALCIAPNMLWLPVTADPEQENKSTKKVASLVQLLIENTNTIFGHDIESVFTNIHGSQENLEDALGDYSPQHYSSDEFDSEQERPKGLHSFNTDTWFLPLKNDIVKEEKEMWSLLDEMDIFKSQYWTEDNVCCMDLDDMPICSNVYSPVEGQGIQSSRGRCSSEPSVCQSSQNFLHSHTTVIRQSSYDATLRRGQASCSQYMSKLHLEETSGPTDDLSPRMSNQPKHMLWRSPQIPSKFKDQQLRLTSPNMSSFSSLSSTATSPSASSLSSLDSAFSYCSDTVFTPSDVSSLDFMFGTSARWQPLTPEPPKKFPMDWTLKRPMARDHSLSFDWYTKCDEQDEEKKPSGRESHNTIHIKNVKESQSEPQSVNNSLKATRDKTGQDLNYETNEDEGDTTYLQITQVQVPEMSTKMYMNEEPDGSQEVSKVQSQETCMKHIQSMKPENLNVDNIKQTKITLYINSNKLSVKNQTSQAVEENRFSVKLSNASTDSPDLKGIVSETVEDQESQAVLYGQQPPLILQSVSTKQPENPNTTNGTLPGTSSESCTSISGPSKTFTKASHTIKHTIRIKLPAAVKSTVKEYFSHTDNKNCQSDVKGPERGLHKSKLEYQSKSLLDAADEDVLKLNNGDDF
ncbi:rho GTPase-activating protein 20 isoform X2 [Brienomyrus brachyistius]|uniref:rho GTPase-activating protein 20 isoform X2 n=1 Tax=Brienomyrus brachyistius TaxID=42636 RepID=UPI0020B20301|nr:rho GTPase-activating protein 20 isoform X2 [Brienomyrus brachyistius]